MKKKSICLIVLIFLSTIILFSQEVIGDDWGDPGTGFWFYSLGPSTFPVGIIKEDWEVIEEKWPNSILFDLTLFSDSLIKGKDFEISEYYIESEDVEKIKFYIWKLNPNTNLSKVTLKVFDPNEEIYCNVVLIEDELHNENETLVIKSLEDDSFTFDKTGLWKFKLYFETDDTTLVWRHLGNHVFQTFKPLLYYDEILDPLIFFDRYGEEIPVITLTDALQVNYVNSVREQSEYLNESAKAQKESSEAQTNATIAQKESTEAQRNTAIAQQDSALMQKWTAFGTIILAIITFLMVLFTAKSSIATSKSVKETHDLVIENQKIRRKDYLEKKFDNLYKFLYKFFILGDNVHGEDKQFISAEQWNRGTRDKIQDNLHFASSELLEFLNKILKSNSKNRIDREIFDGAKESIKKEYEEIKNEIELLSK